MAQALRNPQRQYLDTESRAMIYSGCSTTQLAEIFNMKAPDVSRRLAGVDPVGVGRQGNPLYRISEAAARLIRIPVTPEMITAHLRRMNPKDLPSLLNKIFWEGLTARRKYQEIASELWHTADVALVASEAFQSLRMSILLIPDALMNETELSERQLKIVQSMIDNALEEARERLINRLGAVELSGPRPGFNAEDEPL